MNKQYRDELVRKLIYYDGGEPIDTQKNWLYLNLIPFMDEYALAVAHDSALRNNLINEYTIKNKNETKEEKQNKI